MWAQHGAILPGYSFGAKFDVQISVATDVHKTCVRVPFSCRHHMQRDHPHSRSDDFSRFLLTSQMEQITMKVNDIYAYQLDGVEIEWKNLTRCDDYRCKLANIYAVEQDEGQRKIQLAKLLKFEEFYGAGIEAGRNIGSQGNFLVEPHLGFIPTGLCMSVYLIWEDDDHGSMYVVSPVEMPHLEN